MFKTSVVYILLVLLIILALVLGSFALGWVTLPFGLGSAGNVSKQFTYGYTQYNALKATAGSVCSVKKALDAATNDNEKGQRMTQLSGYEGNYYRLAGEYDAWASNVFTGAVVRPNDLPQRAPTLEEMKEKVCK